MPVAVEQPAGDKPVATRMPQAPPADFMTQDEWEVFYALMDGVMPAFTSKTAHERDGDTDKIVLPDDEFERALERAAGTMPEGPTRDALVGFLASHPTMETEFRDDILRTLERSPAKAKLAKVLGMLNTHTGSLLFTGYWQPITKQPTPIRHAILQSWARSSFPTLNRLAKNIAGLAIKTMTMASPAFHQLSGYTDVPRDWKPAEAYPFDFLHPGPGGDVHVIDTDVVVIGSGCGGAVCARNLAEAGHRVLVVDKGYYFPPSQLPMPQTVACQYLFDNGGAFITDSGGVSILTGSNWGGGGSVNWSVCLRTQDFVRKEWAEKDGLPMFASQHYDECLDRVWASVGAGTSSIRHNHRNRIVLDGAKKLGWRASEAAQNTNGKEHYCGQCHLGCSSGEKRGPAVAWLPAAAEAGAQFMEGFEAEKVLFGEDGKTATGVEGEWLSRGPGGDVSAPEGERTRRRVQIRAKRVIVSAGSIRSPLILMASGIENPQLGRNLHLHPTGVVTATFEDDKRGWEGGIITSYSPEFENLDEGGHGVKLEPVCMVPYTCLSTYPWSSGLDAKTLLLKFGRLESFIAITRDRDTGRVFPDRRTGVPRVDYDVSDFDRAHTLEGVIALAKLCYVGGATEIKMYLPGLDPFVVDKARRDSVVSSGVEAEVKDPEFADPTFAAWLRRGRAVGNRPPVAPFSSAHQMGTCRMAATAEAGVVDGMGKVWGREGLYVADASVFPSASGVNPMITTMAIADWISRGLSEKLRG